jgi:hypothetical protein
MNFEKEIARLNVLVKKQQEQITYLENRLNEHNNELVVIGEELYLCGRNGYPSLYDVKQKLLENGVVKKNQPLFL